jgi:heme o synthase
MAASTSIETTPQNVAAAAAPGWRRTGSDYLSLTKPRIVELLLITTVPAMLVAAGGWPGAGLLLATVVAGALVSGSAHATNMVLDRDIDGAMRRTAHRPVPSGRISPRAASVFAAVLFLTGTMLMLMMAGWLAAALTAAAWAWYVGIYTIWLKRRSVHNIVIGGVAGAAPPMIGWAAVTGSVAPAALVLFAVVVLWTPTHFWALAVGTGTDYARANVPMLPVVRGPKVAARHGAGYAIATVVASLALPLTGVGGVGFVLVAGALGAVFITRSVRLIAQPDPKAAWKVFHTSNAYLATLFVVVGITGLVG